MSNIELDVSPTQLPNGENIEIGTTKEQHAESSNEKYTCHCGKSYGLFKNYKSHYVKYKCQPRIIVNSESGPVIELANGDVLDIGYNPILKSRRQLISRLDTHSKDINTYINRTSQDTTDQNIARTPGEINTSKLVVEVLTDNKFAECANCGLRLLKKNMRRHQSNNCKTSRELQLKQQLEAAKNILSEYNNILVNNGIIGSNNVINDNRQIINVAINCITKEDKDHLTEEAKVEIVGRIFTAFDCLLDHIYKDDRNKNIYYLGNGKKEVKYISENGEVNVGDADNIIGNIAMSHLNYLDELIDTHRDAVPKPYQKTIDQLINFHSTEDCNPGYIKKTGQKIMSFRDYAKAQVKRYEQEYISKHSGGTMVSN